MYPSRLQLLRTRMQEENLHGHIVTKKENIFYLTGTQTIHPTNREAILLVTATKALLYHSTFLVPYRVDFLTTIAMSQSGYQQVLETAFSLETHNSQHPTRIGIESQNLTVAELERLKTLLPIAEYVPTHNVLEEMRIIKEKEEIQRMKKACEISEKGMKWIQNIISRNSAKKITEIELAKRLEHKFFELGAKDLAYPTIVAFDTHSALPHHQPTTTPLTKESVVLIDAGCNYMGYCSDMTRTIKLGKKSSEFSTIEHTVKTAYNKAIETLAQFFTVTELTNSKGVLPYAPTTKNPGGDITASEVDLAAREYIKSKGYGDKFIHSTGHGLGLEIHEQPSIYNTNATPLSPNTTLTIEPGIYIEGKFGVRHENTILITL